MRECGFAQLKRLNKCVCTYNYYFNNNKYHFLNPYCMPGPGPCIIYFFSCDHLRNPMRQVQLLSLFYRWKKSEPQRDYVNFSLSYRGRNGGGGGSGTQSRIQTQNWFWSPHAWLSYTESTQKILVGNTVWKAKKIHIETNAIVFHQVWFFLWPRTYLTKVSFPWHQSQSSKHNFSKQPFDVLSLINLLESFVTPFVSFQSTLCKY